MCGIAGYTHLDGRPEPERIRQAVTALTHRGPNQQGVFESDRASLGAARLKILDLESGDQPVISPDGQTIIVFNGEIYNHAELRRDLELRGHRFRSRTDTEVVLVAFLEWDLECFSRLRGMFALAMWSEARQRLVLARDRMGIKPLFIARRKRDLYFGSELKAIFVHPEIDRQLSLAGLDCYLSMNYVPAPYSMVEGIEKLLPGHWLEWLDGKTRSEPYWRLPTETEQNCSLEWAEVELDALLKQSIREHLAADVPVGIWLSGGLDSSTILHYASAASASRLKTFSISFTGRSFDETEHIRRVAAAYGTDHEQFDVNPDSGLADAIRQFAWFLDEPNGDGGALPVWFLSRLTSRSVTVALSGEGADELFGGYLTYRADQLARQVRRAPHWVLRSAEALARCWPVSDDKIGFEYMLKRFLAGCLMPADLAHIYWNGTFSEQEKSSLVNVPLPGTLAGVLRGLSPHGDAVDTYLRFDQRCYLPDDILAKVDHISMAHSIEVRPPFLDHRIVELAASMPDRLKVRGRMQKIVLRELMKRKLPESTVRRKKVGFDFPAHDWLRGPLRTLLLDTMSDAAQNAGLFQRGILEDYVQRHLKRHANLGYHLWGLMLLFLWLKEWRIQSPQVLEKVRVNRAPAFTPA